MGGFHMGFGGSPDAAASVLDSIRAAGAMAQRQQQQFQQQSLKDQFETELKLRKDGYTPFMQTTGQDASGLKRRDAQQVDPSRVISDHFGRKWVAPAPEAAAAATPQQTFTDTTNLLERGARPVDAGGNVAQDQQIPRYRMDEQGNVSDTGMFGVHAAAPEGSTVTPPGSKQAFFVPGEEEKAGLAARLKDAGQPGTTSIDTEHFSAPVSVNHKTGEVTALKLPAGVTHNEKADKTSKYTFSYHTDDHGNVHVLRGDPDSGEVTETKVIKGAGSARQDDIAERGNERKQDRTEAREQRRQDAGQKQIEAFQTQEQAQHELRSKYGSAIAVADGEQVMDPKSGQLLQMNKARREGYRRIFQAATDKVGELQERQKSIVKKFGGDAGQQTAGQQGRGKLTDASIAQQYVQKAGGDKAKARQMAKADGWEF